MKSNDPNSITDRLHHLVAREMELVHDRFRNLGLNNQQARLLKYVSEHPGTIQKDVAQYLNRQNATVTNMLKVLEKQGYVSRRIPDDNERQKQLYLEAKGEELIASINAVFAALETEVRDAIPENERESLVKNLNRIQSRLDKLSLNEENDRNR
ncbi:MarR family winged helix-turn-helix transcriptional regulator [Secundilactobacillus collinoides]|nr:MarR family transcriptional regulator [Secundilactobacillus collinoides]